MSAEGNRVLYYCGFVLAALAIVGSFGLESIYQGQNSSRKSWLGLYTIVQFCALAIAMLLVWYAAPRSQKYRDYRFLFCFAVIVQLLLIPVESYTSNDISRYLFDGKLLIEGYDPYRVAHDALEIISLREQWQPPPEHASYVTLYPPAAIALFGIAASAGLEWALLAWKAMVALSALATLLLCALILKQINRLYYLPLIALSPLLILESGIGGHIDTMLTLAVAATVLMWLKHRYFWCGFFIGVGTLIKLLPIVLLLPLVLSMGAMRPIIRLMLGTILALSLGYGSAAAFGLLPVGSIDIFFQKWRFGAPLFSLLEAVTSLQGLVIILSLLSIVLGILIGAAAWRQRLSQNYRVTGLLMQYSMMLPFLFSPVVFPWYLCSLLPLLLLFPNALLISWMVFIPFTYEVLGLFIGSGQWQPAAWPLYLMVIAMIVGIFIDYKNKVWLPSSIVHSN